MGINLRGRSIHTLMIFVGKVVICVKVRVYKNDDDTYTVFVKRTLAKENPSRAIPNVPIERVEEVVDRLAREMRGQAEQEFPL